MVRNNSAKTTLANSYKGLALFGALFSSDPGITGTATGELSGGSYARISVPWGTASNGVVTSTAMVFNVASGATVAYFGVCTSGTATTADVQDSFALTSQLFNSAGTYTVTATYTQT